MTDKTKYLNKDMKLPENSLFLQLPVSHLCYVPYKIVKISTIKTQFIINNK